MLPTEILFTPVEAIALTVFKLTLPEPDIRSLLEIIFPVKLALDPSLTLPAALIVKILVPEVVTGALISILEVE